MAVVRSSERAFRGLLLRDGRSGIDSGWRCAAYDDAMVDGRCTAGVICTRGIAYTQIKVNILRNVMTSLMAMHMMHLSGATHCNGHLSGLSAVAQHSRLFSQRWPRASAMATKGTKGFRGPRSETSRSMVPTFEIKPQ